MTWWEALLLGVVQGVFMFVPVSSTSHLVVSQHALIALGSDLPSPGAAEMVLFDLVVHVGTLVSIAVVFRRSLAGFLSHFVRDVLALGRVRAEVATPAGAASPLEVAAVRPNGARASGLALRLALLGVVTVGVTGVIGLALYEGFRAVFDRPVVIAGTLTITGVVLWMTDRLAPRTRGLRRVGIGTAVIVGLAQAAALLPGISRSGMTIGAALFSGMRRRWAAEYSFFVAIPTILLATLVQAFLVWREGTEMLVGLVPLAIGFVSAALVGIVALRLVLRLLYRSRLRYFSYYVWALAAGVLVFSLAT
jgi:undecaprenyl-diphosphatase